MNNDGSSLPRRSYKRLLLGIFVLLIVDVIWVVSAELTEFIFHDSNFDKPFFSTYLKTSILSMYLLCFLFVKRWRLQLLHILKGNEPFEITLKNVEIYQRNRQKYGKDTFDEAASDVGATLSSVDIDDVIDRALYGRGKEKGNQGDSTTPNMEVGNVNADLDDGFVKKDAIRQMSDTELEDLKNMLTGICKKISLRYTVLLSLMFVVLWMCANLMYQEALSKTSAAVTNILSSTSSIFTLLIAAVFPSSVSDKFSLSKFLAALISFGGIFLVCWTDPSRKESTLNIGGIYALLGAIFYACYLVLVRKKAGDEGNLDIPLFLGFVGLFGLLLFWPVFFLLDDTDLERFEFPEHQMTWVYLILNGVIGTAISELLWLWGCFLTSSLMATLALGFVLPLTMMWDILVNHIKFSKLFFAGTVPIIACFVTVAVLTHYGDWDPVKDLLVKYFCCRRHCRSHDRKKRYTTNENENGCANNSFQLRDER